MKCLKRKLPQTADILVISYHERKNPVTEGPPAVICTHFAGQIMQEYCINKKLQNLFSSQNVKG
jgi:hypothetical protein